MMDNTTPLDLAAIRRFYANPLVRELTREFCRGRLIWYNVYDSETGRVVEKGKRRHLPCVTPEQLFGEKHLLAICPSLLYFSDESRHNYKSEDPVGFDLVLDLDGLSGATNRFMVLRALEVFSLQGLKKPLLTATGNTGYHLRILWSSIQRAVEPTQFYALQTAWLTLCQKHNISHVDTAVLAPYVTMRQPLSLHHKSGCVCRLITKQEIEEPNLSPDECCTEILRANLDRFWQGHEGNEAFAQVLAKTEPADWLVNYTRRLFAKSNLHPPNFVLSK